MNKSILVTFLLLAAAPSILVSCGKGAYLDHERDRQREAADILANDYKSIAGNYASAPEDISKYQVKMELKVKKVQRDGFLVHQPVMDGRFLVVERKLMNSDDPVVNRLIPYSFTNGIYDSATGEFAAHMAGNGTEGMDVSCKLSRERQRLNCEWSGKNHFSFVLQRDS